ncbi:MAG: hypothetical protein KF788_18165 [Piscinibacter sp.]|nr:hypothetical protein [Piscinibacter sp.]
MRYDRQRNALMVGAPSATGQYALMALSPETLETTWSLPLPSQATAMAISADQSTLFVGVRGGQVLQFDLAARSAVRYFDVTEGVGSGFYPSSLAVRPGTSSTVAVSTSRVREDGFPYFHRLAIWEDGVKWPQTLETSSELNFLATDIVFSDAATLITAESASLDGAIQKILISDKTLTALFPGVEGYGLWGTLQTLGDQILLSTGLVLDPVAYRGEARIAALGGQLVSLPDLGTIGEVTLRSVDVVGGFELVAVEHRVGRFARSRQMTLPLAELQVRDGYRPDMAQLQEAGHGRIAVQLVQPTKGRSNLVVLDLEMAVPIQAPAVQLQTAASEGVSVLTTTSPLSSIAYDPERDRIIGIVPASAGTAEGNSLVVIRPSDGAVESRHLLSSEPSGVFVSAKGSVAYVALPQERGFQRVDIGQVGGPRWKVTGLAKPVLDIAVSPADTDTVAITLTSETTLMVYQGGTRRAAVGEFYPDVRSISSSTFASADELVAYNSRTTSNELQRYRYDGSSLIEIGRVLMPPTWRFDTTFYSAGLVHNNEAYAPFSTDGTQAGWIMTPEEAASFGGYVAIPYQSVTLRSERVGYGVTGASSFLEVDRLAPRAGASGGTDLVGSRRLRLSDSRWPATSGVDRQVIALGSDTVAVRAWVQGTGNAALYVIGGL